MKNDLTREQLAQEVNVKLPLSVLLNLGEPVIPQPAAAPLQDGGNIVLRSGEIYVGAIYSAADPARRYHLILLAEAAEAASWSKQIAWAEKQGGELPDRVESALLFATHPGCFEKEAYWLRDPYAFDESYAWYQYFSYGYQYHTHKGNELRARAVRRVPIASATGEG